MHNTRMHALIILIQDYLSLCQNAIENKSGKRRLTPYFKNGFSLEKKPERLILKNLHSLTVQKVAFI